MHHLSNDPEVEVTPDRLTQFAAEHGGDIEFDNAKNTAHYTTDSGRRIVAHLPKAGA